VPGFGKNKQRRRKIGAALLLRASVIVTKTTCAADGVEEYPDTMNAVLPNTDASAQLAASVVLVVHNQARRLPVLLHHLEYQEFPTADLEVIVVDDGGSDHAAAWLARYTQGSPIRLRTLRSPVRRGLGAARNFGAASAQGHCLIFLDVDLIPPAGFVAAHVAAHGRSTGLSCVLGPVTLHPKIHKHTFTAWFLPEEMRALREDAEESLSFLDCLGCNFSVTHDTLTRMGGFRDDLKADPASAAELAWRILAAGGTLKRCTDADAHIWHPAELREELRKAFEKGRSLYQLYTLTHDPRVLRRYGLHKRGWRRLVEGLTHPYYVRLCEQVLATHSVRVHSYRRVLRHEIYRGFQWARRRSPARVKA
jgi:glycosyltransferase involved in cell wall biosynthesis